MGEHGEVDGMEGTEESRRKRWVRGRYRLGWKGRCLVLKHSLVGSNKEK